MQDGGRDVTNPPQNQVEYKTYTEAFYAVLPTYLLYGMTSDEFWDQQPVLAQVYREKHRLEMEQTNQFLWMQGLYNYEGFSTAMANAFAKKGSAPKTYPEKPHRITPLTEIEKEKEKEQIVENFRSQLDALDRKFKAKHKRGE